MKEVQIKPEVDQIRILIGIRISIGIGIGIWSYSAKRLVHFSHVETELHVSCCDVIRYDDTK